MNDMEKLGKLIDDFDGLIKGIRKDTKDYNDFAKEHFANRFVQVRAELGVLIEKFTQVSKLADIYFLRLDLPTLKFKEYEKSGKNNLVEKHLMLNFRMKGGARSAFLEIHGIDNRNGYSEWEHIIPHSKEQVLNIMDRGHLDAEIEIGRLRLLVDEWFSNENFRNNLVGDFMEKIKQVLLKATEDAMEERVGACMAKETEEEYNENM